MINQFRISLLILLFVLSQFAVAQSGNKKSDKLLEKGLAAERARDLPNAKKNYQASLDKFPQNQEALHRLGLIYRIYDNEIDSMLWAFAQLAAMPNMDPKYSAILYYVGDGFFRSGNYIEAQKYVVRYIEEAKPTGRTQQQANALLKDIQFSIQNQIRADLRAPQEELIIKGAPENIYFPEFTPDRESMIFTGLVQNQEDIFITRYLDGEWEVPRSISPNINTADNEGASTISADGRVLIFTACNRRDGFGSCDLYVSYKEGEQWSKPQNLGKSINSGAWESQPSLSADGKTLYFCSNRKGGMGGRDIYVSYLIEKEWTPALNLGPVINTPGDEISPFIYADGKTLFFGSNGLPTFGGFDIYYAQKGKDWSEPQNIGNHINDHDDQISIFISSDQEDIYFSTEKKIGRIRSSKIYKTLKPAIAELPLKQTGFIKGLVSDADTKQPLKAKIQLFDIEKDTLLYEVYSDPVTGQYLMVIPYQAVFSFYAESAGYMLKSGTYEILESTENFVFNIGMQAIKEGLSFTLDHIYFDFDSYELKPSSNTEIKRIVEFLKANPDTKVEIAGYADPTGSVSYNLTLSTKRAEAVFKRLLELNIPKGNLTFKGYGATEGNDSARRVELKIVK